MTQTNKATQQEIAAALQHFNWNLDKNGRLRHTAEINGKRKNTWMTKEQAKQAKQSMREYVLQQRKEQAEKEAEKEAEQQRKLREQA